MKTSRTANVSPADTCPLFFLCSSLLYFLKWCHFTLFIELFSSLNSIYKKKHNRTKGKKSVSCFICVQSQSVKCALGLSYFTLKSHSLTVLDLAQNVDNSINPLHLKINFDIKSESLLCLKETERFPIY